jgi:hypothetical protein
MWSLEKASAIQNQPYQEGRMRRVTCSVQIAVRDWSRWDVFESGIVGTGSDNLGWYARSAMVASDHFRLDSYVEVKIVN